MPNIYIRKQNVQQRGSWTSEALTHAINAVKAGDMGVNEAAVSFGIPKTTLKRRLRTNNMEKSDRLGPDSMLGKEAEKKLVVHIMKLQKHGFAPTRNDVRIMAYNLATRLGIKNKFNHEDGQAGKKWLQSFLRRNTEIRQAENTSVARASGMSKEIVNEYFNELQKVLATYNLFDKPGSIYNTDETGLQLNTRAGKVLAQKGSKSVPAISSSEKGETVSVIACCNAEGVYLPPYCIFKGKNRKDEWSDGMPPGSHIRMSQKSAYVTSEIFLEWLSEHFYPRKPPGKVLLIVDGHTSHTTNIDTLEFAEQHDIIMLCLPPHCTHYLQPLDRAFFKSLKGHYYDACQRMLKTNPNRKLNRMQFGKLLGEAWGVSATVNNAVSAFQATGIVPFIPGAIPDYAFLIQLPEAVPSSQHEVINYCGPESPQPSSSRVQQKTHFRKTSSPQPGPSGIQHTSRTPNKITEVEKITPGKVLQEISPIPMITPSVKKVRTNLTRVLTSPEYMQHRAQLESKKNKIKARKACKSTPKLKKPRHESSSSPDSSDISFDDSSSECENLSDVENECVGCHEDYRLTKKKDDWIQCILCYRWLHENCTSYCNICQGCGANATKKKCK